MKIIYNWIYAKTAKSNASAVVGFEKTQLQKRVRAVKQSTHIPPHGNVPKYLCWGARNLTWLAKS
jgi:hypothetical protein